MFNLRHCVQAFNALFIENDKTFFTIQNYTEYKLYTKSSIKKRTLQVLQRFFIDLKSRLHYKILEKNKK